MARPCQLFIDQGRLVLRRRLGFAPDAGPEPADLNPGQTGGRVSIFDAGKLHARCGGGENPCAPGDFFAPHGIWVDSHGDLTWRR